MSMPVRAMRAAVIFMSRIPVGGFPYSEEEFRAAPGYFPFVGLLVGLSGAPLLFLAPTLGATLSAALALCVTVWVTGAFHEDGLADTADALGGAHSRKKIHDILKDSRIGTYGASALGFSLLIRTLALGRLVDLMGVRLGPALSAPLLFVLVHILSRVGPVGLMASLPYVAGEGAKGSSVAKGGQLPQFLMAVLWGLGALSGAFFVGLPVSLGILLLVVVASVSSLLGVWFKSRAGGFTGDFLGATEQLLEMALLLTIVLVLSLKGAP
jgi:adenosylcobinamide-GDP ribazoletransferase